MRDPATLKKTSAPSIICDGITFNCYVTGLGRTAWMTADGRFWASRNRYTGSGGTYSAYVETGLQYPEIIGHRYRNERNACRALARFAKNGIANV